MRFQCPDIGDAAKRCAAAVSRPVGSIVDAVRITAKDNSVTLMTRGRNAWVSCTVEAAVSEAGAVCVDAADLARIAHGAIDVSSDNTGLTISGSGQFKLPIMEGELPEPPQRAETEREVSTSAFLRLAPFCNPSSHSERDMGVSFEGGIAIAGHGAMFAATKHEDGPQALIPADIARLIPKDARLFCDSTNWRCEAEGYRACGPLISAEFGNIQSAILGAQSVSQFDADEALETAILATAGRAGELVLSFDAESLSLSGSRFTGLHIETEARLRAEGHCARVVLPSAQLQKALKHLSGSVIDLRVSSRAAQFKAAGSDDYVLIGMTRDTRNDLSFMEAESAA